MPLSVTTVYSGPFTPNGATTIFPFDFKALDPAEVAVTDSRGDPIGGLDYSVEIAAEGGNVVFGVAPEVADLASFFIASIPTFEQDVEFTPVGIFNPRTLQTPFDRTAVRDAWLKDRVDRAISFPMGEDIPVLPVAEDRAGRFLAFDAGGNVVAASGTGSDGAFREDVAASGGAALVGTAAGVNAEQMFAVSPLPLTAFASLEAAIEGASAQGRDLALRGTISLATEQEATLSGNLRIIMEAGAVIEYTGVAQIDRLVTITCAGFDIQITGNGSTIDGADLTNRPLVIYNKAASTPNCTINGLTIRNARMAAGEAFNAGASGINIQGSFDRVIVDNINFIDITREAGSGVSSSYGTAGLQLVHSGGAQRARHVRITNITGNNLGTDDAPGSADRVDCDLVSVNQGGLTNEGLGDSCLISNISAVEVLGRAVKCITSCVPIVENVEFSLSETGITGNSTAVNCQVGVGLVTNVTSVLRTDALTADSNHTPVSFFTSATRTVQIGSMIAKDVTLDCDVDAATRCESVIGVENSSATDVTRKLAILKDIVSIGQSVEAIVSIGNNGITKSGNPDPFALDIDGFDGELTRCAIRSGGSPVNMQASLRSVRNTGSAVDAVKRNDNASLGEQFGFINDGGGNIGIVKNNGGVPAAPSISGPLLTQVADQTSRTVGRTVVLARALTAGETVELSVGLAGAALLSIGSQDYGAPGIYHTNSSDTITTVQAATGVTAGSGGVDPGSGSIRVWKSSSGTKLTVKNNDGVSRQVFVESVG